METSKNLLKNATLYSPSPCPYDVFETVSGYGFITKDGTEYSLSFIKVDSTYPLYSFSIDRLSDTYHSDDRVKATIIHVLVNFFENEYNAMLYTCDITGGKHFARQRLFNQWYQEYKDVYQRNSYCSEDILSTIITRRDNPLAKDMVRIFMDLQDTLVEAIKTD